MKRLIIILCLVAGCVSASYSQKWNVIGENIKKSTSINVSDEYITLHYGRVTGAYKTITIESYAYTDAYGTVYILSHDSTTNTYSYLNTRYKGSKIVKDSIALSSIPENWTFLRTNTIYKQVPSSTVKIEDITLITVPKHIYDRYALGDNLMKAGWIHFGVGLGVTAVGGIVYSCGLKQTNPSNMANMTKAGAITMGVGGTLVSVSLPMLWFGDNIKRESNMHWKTYDILK